MKAQSRRALWAPPFFVDRFERALPQGLEPLGKIGDWLESAAAVFSAPVFLIVGFEQAPAAWDLNLGSERCNQLHH